MQELVSKRTEKGKVFIKDDGSFLLRLKTTPIHYRNGLEMREIDTALHEEAGVLKTANTKFDLNLKADKTEVDLGLSNISVGFRPVDKEFNVDVLNTGVRKVVKLDKKPATSSISFKLICPQDADIYYTDASNIKLVAAARARVKSKYEECRSLELQGRKKEAVSAGQEVKRLERALQVSYLSKWNKTDPVFSHGGLEIHRGGEIIFVRPASVWDSNGEAAAVPVSLSVASGEFIFTKHIPESFLDNATYPIYTDASASYQSAVGDGYVRNNAGAVSWATAIGAATGTFTDYTSAQTYLMLAEFYGGTSFDVRRGFGSWDASGLGTSAIITGANIILAGGNSPSKIDADTSGIDIVQGLQASVSVLANSDFGSIGSTVFATKALSAYNDAGDNTFALDSNGINNISLTTDSKFAFISTREAGSAPTGINRAAVNYSEATGTASDPELAITYTIPSGAVNLLLLGVG